MGRGCPKAIQNRNASEVKPPTIAPGSVADSVPMPSVNMPNNGPPTIPKMVKPACDERKSRYRHKSILLHMTLK